MAYTFEPAVVTDADGNESISHEQGELKQSNHFHHGNAPMGFEVDEMTGEATYYESDEVPEPIQTNDAYIAAIGEAYPQLPDALTFAQASLDAELMNHFYTAADDGDYENFHAFLEIILNEYEEHLESNGMTAEIEVEDEQPDEVEDEEQTLETPDLSGLYGTEVNPELAYDHMDNADNAEDEVEKLLWSLSAAFHNNDMTVDECVTEALSAGFSRDELIRTFNLLSQPN